MKSIRRLPALITLAFMIMGGGGPALATHDASTGDQLCPSPPKTDFRASWIWVPESAGYDRRNSYAYFRKAFSAAGVTGAGLIFFWAVLT